MNTNFDNRINRQCIVSAQTPMILPMTRIQWAACLGGCFSDNLHVYYRFLSFISVALTSQLVSLLVRTQQQSTNITRWLFVNTAQYDNFMYTTQNLLRISFLTLHISVLSLMIHLYKDLIIVYSSY